MSTLRTRFGMSTEVAVLLAVSMVAVIATLLATSRYGIGMNSDAVEYRIGAQSIADGLGFTRNGSASTIVPPGYSAALSIGERFGAGEGGAIVIASVGFVATIVLGFVLLRRHVRSTSVVIAATVLLGSSAVLLSIFKRSLSEHLFIVVVLLLLLAAEDLVARPRDLRLLAGMAALVWAGFYLRYAGIVLLPFAALVVLIASWPLERLVGVLRSATFTVVGLSVPLLWMLRNADTGNGPMGTRRDAEASPVINVARAAYTLVGWVSFQGPTLVRVGAFVASLAVAAALVILALPVRAKVAARVAEIWPLVLFVVVYLAYLVATASVVAFAPINTRYLIPVYVPLVVLGAWTYERALPRLHPSGRAVLATVVVVWLATNVVWFGAHTVASARDGAGLYSTATWHDSELMEDVRHWDQAVPLVTNDYNAVELFTGRHVTETVAKTFVGSNEPARRLKTFVERVRCEGHIGLAWFTTAGTRTRLYSPEQLAEHLQVEEVVRRKDGVVYDLSPLPSDPGSGASCAPGD
jgi:hypothetical protein